MIWLHLPGRDKGELKRNKFGLFEKQKGQYVTGQVTLNATGREEAGSMESGAG